jgi:hypothetical protein
MHVIGHQDVSVWLAGNGLRLVGPAESDMAGPVPIIGTFRHYTRFPGMSESVYPEYGQQQTTPANRDRFIFLVAEYNHAAYA